MRLAQCRFVHQQERIVGFVELQYAQVGAVLQLSVRPYKDRRYPHGWTVEHVYGVHDLYRETNAKLKEGRGHPIYGHDAQILTVDKTT